MALIVAAGIAGQVIRVTSGHEWVYGLVPRTDLNMEGAVPAYFNALLLALCSVLLAVVAICSSRTGHSYRRHWAALSLIFLWFSVDEAAAFHELFTEPLRAALDTHGIFFYAWLIPAMAGVALFAACFLKFFINLPSCTRRRFAVAAGVLLLGAMGFEMIGSLVAEQHGEGGFDYVLLVAIEESLEMAGAILFISALLRHIAIHIPHIDLKFSRR